jgi:hypothetical protein
MYFTCVIFYLYVYYDYINLWGSIAPQLYWTLLAIHSVAGYTTRGSDTTLATLVVRDADPKNSRAGHYELLSLKLVKQQKQYNTTKTKYKIS